MTASSSVACASAVFVSVALLQGCAADATWRPAAAGAADQSLRGVCVVNADVVWASGTGGTVLRSVDGGVAFERIVVAGAEALDFRDVHAVDAHRAWLLVAGTPARVYATDNGGATWRVQLEDQHPDAFYDSFAFWEPRAAVLFGDQQDGVLAVRTTADGGGTWRPVEAAALPAPRPGENGFAASGTCTAVWGEAHAWIGTGGGAARVLRSSDRGVSWEVAPTPMRQGGASQGIFSLAFRDRRNGVAVGGDYQDEASTEANAIWTDDGGVSWQLSVQPPRGYRSGVAFVPGALTPTCIAVGPSGSDYSVDGGKTWRALDDTGFHAVAVSPDGSAAWCVGAGGRLHCLERPNLLAKRQ